MTYKFRLPKIRPLTGEMRGNYRKHNLLEESNRQAGKYEEKEKFSVLKLRICRIGTQGIEIPNLQ